MTDTTQDPRADYNNDSVVNPDDLSDYINDYFDSVGLQPGYSVPIAIPFGYAGNSTLDTYGYNNPCTEADDVPSPNPWGASTNDYRVNGYKCAVGENHDFCLPPNPDDLADFITLYFGG